MSQSEFEAYVNDRIAQSSESLAAMARKKPLEAGSQIIDIFVDAFREGLAGAVTREQVVAAWNAIYDSFLAKIDIPGSMDVLVHNMIKTLGASLVGRAYDRLVAQ